MARIKIKGTEENKDMAFEILTKYEIKALRDEEYFVPYPALEELKDANIVFEVVSV